MKIVSTCCLKSLRYSKTLKVRGKFQLYAKQHTKRESYSDAVERVANGHLAVLICYLAGSFKIYVNKFQKFLSPSPGLPLPHQLPLSSKTVYLLKPINLCRQLKITTHCLGNWVCLYTQLLGRQKIVFIKIITEDLQNWVGMRALTYQNFFLGIYL